MQEPRTLRRWQLSPFGREHLEQVELPLPAARPGPDPRAGGRGVAQLPRPAAWSATAWAWRSTCRSRPAPTWRGTVVAVGPGVQRFAIGDRVVNTFWGGWIDGQWPAGAGAGRRARSRACWPRTCCSMRPGPWRRRPRWTSPKRARCRAPASPRGSRWPKPARWRGLDETVLIHGTGGVALFGLQLARLHGARAIVVSGSEDKRAQARALGATPRADARTATGRLKCAGSPKAAAPTTCSNSRAGRISTVRCRPWRRAAACRSSACSAARR